MQKKGVRYLAQGAAVAALYIVLSYLSFVFGLSGTNPVQIRLSEMLTVLPVFLPAAVPGLFVGCVLTNILTGCALWDVVFGSAATLLAAIITRAIRKYRWLAPLPPIICNTAILPPVLSAVYGEAGIPYLIFTVGLGELISCGVLGTALTALMNKYKDKIIR